MARAGPIAQDWEPVVIRKKAPTAAARKDEKAVNAARRAGAEIETVRKGLSFSLYVCTPIIYIHTFPSYAVLMIIHVPLIISLFFWYRL